MNNNSNIDFNSIFDTSLLLNRYKNVIKQKLLLFLKNNEEKTKINFGDSLFNFLNKNCINNMEHMKQIQKTYKIFDLMQLVKILYLNNIIVSTKIPSKLMLIIKDNLEKFSSLTILEEYYGVITNHNYLIDNDLISIQIVQKNTTTIIPLIQIQNNNTVIDNINYNNLFCDQKQLQYIKNYVNEPHDNRDKVSDIYLLERLNIMFDYFLNNLEIINLDFFIVDNNLIIDNTDLLNTCYEIYVRLGKYFNVNFIFPEQEFNRRMNEFLTRLQNNYKIITNKKDNNAVTDLETNYDLKDYYNAFRDIDLNNNSVIYNYSIDSNKRNKVNNSLYKIIKMPWTQTDNNKNYKEYNNYIRDVAYSFSSKYNKQLFYDNLICFIYFELPSDLYLKDIIYMRPGNILTLVTNTFAFIINRDPNLSNVNCHFVQVKLSWYNIFLLLQIQNDINIILPYGTQLQIESISSLDLFGNYYFKTKCINTLVDNKNININDFIRINRKLKMK